MGNKGVNIMKLKTMNGTLIGTGESIKEIAEKNKSSLSGSNLSGSSLSGSDLSWSDLSGSNLRWSSLCWSNLRWSNLSGSNLSWSDLRGSDLSGSDLRGSDLSWSVFKNTKRNDWLINRPPIQMTGFGYSVIIFDEHMEIGCEKHSFKDWEKFTDEEIIEFDGKDAFRFWEKNKKVLLDMCKNRADIS